MPSPLTVWTNLGLKPDLATDFERRLAPHRVVWAGHRAATNLTSAAPDETLVDECDIAVGQPTVEDIFAAKKLKLVCLSSAGYTRYDRDDLRDYCQSKGIALCNASGVYTEPCAQHVFAFMLALARRLPDALAAQAAVQGKAIAKSFRRPRRDETRGREVADASWPSQPMRAASVLLAPGTTVAIVGYGAIARRLVELLTPFGMNLIAFRRKPQGDENCKTFAIDALGGQLADADHIVNILPLNDATKFFFNADRIGQFKRDTRFYNIGRGDTVDQDALIRALVSGQVSQAYLDVTSPEPLPPEDPLWIAPNCFITPHTAGGSADETQRQLAHFVENVRRFERGEAVIDRIF